MHQSELVHDRSLGRRRPREAGSPDRRPARLAGVVLLAAVAALATACGSSGGGTGGGSTPAAGGAGGTALLGPVSAATGAPVKLGVVTGKSATGDKNIEGAVAQAAVGYLNQRKGGLSGHRIELVTCDATADPSSGTDCGNKMIQSNVVAVVVGSTAVPENVWEPLHAAKVPTMFYATSGARILADRDSTFVLSDSLFGPINTPLQLAKEKGLKKVAAVVIDVPPATALFKTAAPALYKAAGVELSVVPVPLGTADMTPQMQKIAAGGPTLVEVIGNDSFCISAFNGLKAVGFSGPIASVGPCISDATRKAVSKDVLKGMTVVASEPSGSDNPSTRLYDAVATTYGKDIDTSVPAGLSLFSTIAGFQTAVGTLSGTPTPASVIAAVKAMPEKELPAAGGMRFRCGAQANSQYPAICVRGGLITNLDDHGNPTSYRVVTGAAKS